MLPSPEKKKYSKDHIIVLIMIYFFKNVLSINDTNTLISPAVEKYFHNEDVPLADMYNMIISGISEINDNTEIKKLYDECSKKFDFSEYDNADYLETLAYITMLSYQAYIRQQLVIKLIDNMVTANNSNDEHKDE